MAQSNESVTVYLALFLDEVLALPLIVFVAVVEDLEAKLLASSLGLLDAGAVLASKG